MIRKISETNPMRHFATHECVYEWSAEMSLEELHNIFHIISSVDGDKSEEVIWVRSPASDRRSKGLEMELMKTPTVGKDWYWCFPNRRRRDEILVYLTTEKQQTYFSMAPTGKFPDDEDSAEAILNKIRNHRHNPPSPLQPKQPVNCQTALDKIRTRLGK